ncbi:type IIA DNA topoisomerase subunit B [Promethearchaeum syntrophicum]|uniref:DNA topoisomerase (ATP-hydrolyzing) n=1 Tax=Promethearchaeum syntrophicum TaxID=2594042 RepID=A0A5B9DBM9_9ARCH|nr:DNA topoisomerase subunit B [Candidatus Prometheoarchaeum syntrophicum]QEE16375.1 DNA gyrase subunit B [Candidatus Prometheoarchaeum syntrophicum]
MSSKKIQLKIKGDLNNKNKTETKDKNDSAENIVVQEGLEESNKNTPSQNEEITPKAINKNEFQQKTSKPESKIKKDYNAENIVVLEGLEGIRKRPSMYIGSQGRRGFHHLAFEVIDNSIDEVIGGFCSKIQVILEADNSCTIRDNGRGIPVSKHPKKGVSSLEIVFTSLHSGGKFDKKSYAVSGGLHGVGLAVVNACSEWSTAKVRRNGKLYKIKMARGHIIDHLSERETDRALDDTGTEIQFLPDKEIFTGMEEEQYLFDYDYLAGRLRDLAYLNPIEIEIIDRRAEKEKSEIFKYEDGLADFVNYLNKAKKTLHENIVHFKKKSNGIIVELSFQYNESYNEIVQSFVNNINTIEGGTHLTGFKSALSRVFNNYIKDHQSQFKNLKDKTLKGTDVREGIVAILSVSVPEPQFEGQTKTKLGNPEVKTIVSDIVYEEVYHHFDSNPKETKSIIHKCISAQQARLASQKARELTRRKSALETLRLPGKLADCSSKKAEECEIFIVEGDSAGGSAKQGRNRSTQAILPLRGKILNVEKSRIGKILENKEIAAMIKAIGVGIDEGKNNGDEEDDDDDEESQFDISQLRYHKIIIMCDADVDGHHIETLLLTFFFRYMRPLIDEGHIYLAVPPIYKLNYKNKFKYLYIADEAKLLNAELESFMKEHKISDISKIKVQRYKGLGEMNPEELWDTTMEPENRRLIRVKYDDFTNTDILFSILMGSEVAPRREYIVENYNKVLNLDI